MGKKRRRGKIKRRRNGRSRGRRKRRRGKIGRRRRGNRR